MEQLGEAVVELSVTELADRAARHSTPRRWASSRKAINVPGQPTCRMGSHTRDRATHCPQAVKPDGVREAVGVGAEELPGIAHRIRRGRDRWWISVGPFGGLPRPHVRP